MPYNAAMKPAQLIGPRLRRVGISHAPRPTLTPSQAQYYNRGVSTFAALRSRNPKLKPLTHSQYYNAGVLTAYGKMDEAKLQLGDFFNDVMGAIVPGWDQRPEELKKIKLTLDPRKVYAQATKMLSPDQAAKVAAAAQQAGVNVSYRGVPMTPEAVRAAYESGGVYAAYQAGGAAGVAGLVPTWAWIAGGVGLVLVFAARR